ncbi:MAG: HAMP domain-containing histidine kinase [Hamadaea sp.]|uniref:sensor histidine kinase n=1 Tax=Hamadaea sp. TaxID=2024425 RepID=UPI0018305F64|nr:HAMP domain-containing sensor histidine kinase [Hamadaea sp.]NUR72555.1 HAMP domain-containing histidine kinase [Hamadaea sp.]NUT20568.1 HAMP domain-containing histidine kinase [Hamadaea sp.]
MSRWSLRVRLTVLYGGLFVLAGALLLGVTYFLVERSLDARMGASAGNLDFRPKTLDSLGTIEVNGQKINIPQAIIDYRAQQEQFRRDTLDSLVTGGAIALAGVGVVAGAFGWLVAGRALQPLSRITETARRIAGAPDRGLHERIALAGPKDEVKELADTFDTMMERLDRSFDGQRRFVANASHELRTPLALNRALVELAVSRPDAVPQTRQLGESLLSVNERHERLIDGLLTLAESETAVVETVPVDLAEVAQHVLDQALVADRKVSAQLRTAPTTGDPVLLERLAQNLVENAIRHNLPEDGWLSVHTATIDGQAQLVVENSGPVVPKYEIETLFQPFRRMRHERTAERGFGLGLSIVRAVARAHGGEVTAEPRTRGGLTVTVTLPAS